MIVQKIRNKKWKVKPFLKKHHVLIAAIFFAIIFLLVYGRYFCYPGRVMVTSVSTDGDYAITTDDNGFAILWDLKKHKEHILSRKADIYSAYFIKNSHLFMWQDFSDDIVHVRNVNGKEVKSFYNFPVYGQVMGADLKTYVASDWEWDLFSGVGKKQNIILVDDGGFWGNLKLLNLMLSKNNNYLLTSGDGSEYDQSPLLNYKQSLYNYYYRGLFEGVVLWNLQKGIPIRKYPGNIQKTFATLSPNDKYIVSGDEQPFAYVWLTHSGKRLFKLDYLFRDCSHCKNKRPPKEFFYSVSFVGSPYQEDVHSSTSIVSMKFIDRKHYLRFCDESPYAILYKVTSPQPLKYLSLGIHPPPSTGSYVRDESIDTSPQAHVLVTGKDRTGGIIVYHYDPKTQTLKKVWAPKSIRGVVERFRVRLETEIIRGIWDLASNSHVLF